jgi:hypothetical protein
MRTGKLLLAIGIVGVQVAAFAFSPDNDEKVTICHIPPGNLENLHEIQVSEHAVNAHLEHGDSVGHCDPSGASGSTNSTMTLSGSPN